MPLTRCVELSIRDKAMVLLAGSTGLRRSELIALTWGDVNEATLEVSIQRSCVRNRIGNTKTESSARPVPLWCSRLFWSGRRNRGTAIAQIFCSRLCVSTARSR